MNLCKILLTERFGLRPIGQKTYYSSPSVFLINIVCDNYKEFYTVPQFSSVGG